MGKSRRNKKLAETQINTKVPGQKNNSCNKALNKVITMLSMDEHIGNFILFNQRGSNICWEI